MKSFEPFWNSTGSQDPSAEAWNPSNPSEILLVLLLTTKNPALKHEILRTLLKFYWYYSLLPRTQHWSMKSFEPFWNSTGTTPYYQEPSTEAWNHSNPSEILLVLRTPALKHEILRTLLRFYWYYSLLPRAQHWSMKSFEELIWNSTGSQDPSAKAWNPSNPSEILLVLLLTTKSPALKHEILETLLKFYWYYSLLPRTQHWSMKSFEELIWNSTGSQDPSAKAWNPSNPSEILLVLLLTTKNPALKHEILRRTLLKFYWFSGPQRWSMKSFEPFWNSTGTTPYYQEPSTEAWNPSNPSEILLVLLLTTKNPALKHEILRRTHLKFYWFSGPQRWSMKSFEPFWNSTGTTPYYQEPSTEAWNPSKNSSEILLVLDLTTKDFSAEGWHPSNPSEILLVFFLTTKDPSAEAWYEGFPHILFQFDIFAN